MKRTFSKMIMLLSFLACERQDLLTECVCTNSAKIPISIDWSRSGITPQNVTVLFYNNNSDGSLVFEHRYEHNNNEVQSYVHIPVGEYTVVVFNELRNQIKNVSVRGYENLSTLGFYANENLNAMVRSKYKKYIHSPGMLGVKTIKNLVVTNELIAYTHNKTLTKVSESTKSNSDMLLNIVPDNKINWINIKVHVKGLNNARMPVLVDLQNISEGYMVSNDKNSMTPAIMQFNMNNRAYDEGSKTEGTISTRVALFGTLGERNSVEDHTADVPIIIHGLFMLVDKDKTLIKKQADITNFLIFDNDIEGSISLSLDIDATIPLPNVKPEDNGGSGFESEVEDWGVVDVPL